MSAYEIILLVYSLAVMATVLLPSIKKDHWIFRIFDYPRVQKFTLTGIALVLWLAFFQQINKWFEIAIVAVLGISFLRLGYMILPFTPFGKKMIKRTASADNRKTLNLIVANVYQPNTSYEKVLQLVKKRNPDIVFLLETDRKWFDAVQVLKEEYKYFIEIPLDNTYGMLFYSRLPIKSQQINHLIDAEIPSIIADIEFDNKVVRIYGVHPTPPVPQEATHSTNRDAELLIVGKMAKKHAGPCMVIGDLNDVAWSYSTKLFLKASGLLDPRLGRGMYSTFHAKYVLLRWPLDHFFVSKHFHLVNMKVEEKIDSDHFPIRISLLFAETDDAEQIEADSADKQHIDDKIEAGIKGEPQ